jgi:hypothetical protein
MQKTFENSDDPSMKRFAVKGPVESTGGLAGLAAPVMGTRWRGGFERILICPA